MPHNSTFKILSYFVNIKAKFFPKWKNLVVLTIERFCFFVNNLITFLCTNANKITLSGLSHFKTRGGDVIQAGRAHTPHSNVSPLFLRLNRGPIELAGPHQFQKQVYTAAH